MWYNIQYIIPQTDLAEDAVHMHVNIKSEGIWPYINPYNRIKSLAICSLTKSATNPNMLVIEYSNKNESDIY